MEENVKKKEGEMDITQKTLHKSTNPRGLPVEQTSHDGNVSVSAELSVVQQAF